MNEFEQFKAEMEQTLREMNPGSSLDGLRLAADESIANLVHAGWPRAAAGAATMMVIADELGKLPSFQEAKLLHLLGQIAGGRPPGRPLEMTIAMALVVSIVAPDPEWSDAPG